MGETESRMLPSRSHLKNKFEKLEGQVQKRATKMIGELGKYCIIVRDCKTLICLVYQEEE